MSLIPLNTWNIVVLISCYLVSLLSGKFIVGPIMGKLWKKFLPASMKRNSLLVSYFGLIESFLYTTAILVNLKEFVPIWLALKVAGEWSQTKTETDRPMYYLFMIGNGLQIIFAVGSAFIALLLFRI